MSSAAAQTEESSPRLEPGDVMFGRFIIPSASVFYRSESSYAFVNLRPIVPGHVLIIPQEIAPTMADLSEEAYLDMWRTVRVVQRALVQEYQATAFNVAVQDGRAAGQSVPHVHVHILPRRQGDYQRNDDIYTDLEIWAPRPELQVTQSKLKVPEDGDRRDRTLQEMADEAAVYRKILEEYA